jgi:RNA recognition motif-containing protein
LHLFLSSICADILLLRIQFAGFAFITFEDDQAANAARASLHNQTYQGRVLTVKQALPRGGEESQDVDNDNRSGSGDCVIADDSWKTAPPIKNKEKVIDKKAGTTTVKSKKKEMTRRSWNEWAGPA